MLFCHGSAKLKMIVANINREVGTFKNYDNRNDKADSFVITTAA